MNYNEFDAVLKEAESVRHQADLWANRMAQLLIGSLRGVSHSNLARLKAELKNFNATTGQWK